MRRMKKLFAVILAVLTMSMAFAGCSSEETYISFDEVYNQLTSSIDFSASKMQKQTEAALNNYYYIDPATLEDYAIYMATTPPATPTRSPCSRSRNLTR